MLLAITKVPNGGPTSQEVEGSAEQCLAQPKWAHQLLLLENKLAALREQLSREKPPDHIASFVAKNIADSLSNLEFPISDNKIAEILFKDFGQKPLQSLYYSLYDSLRLSRFGDRSAITAAVGLELAKLCGLNERSKIRIDNRLTFVPLNNASDGPNPFIIALLAGRIDVAKLIIEEDAPNSTKNWDGMTVYCNTDGRVSASRTSVYKISPLQLISALGEPEALRYLLSKDILAKQKKTMITSGHPCTMRPFLVTWIT